MTVMILALLIQAQTPTIDDRIAKFVQGDAAAREALIKLGAAAIRPLQGARDKAPEKIDELVFEIKKASAYPRETKAPAALEAKSTLEIKKPKVRDAVAQLQESCGAALVCDGFEPADLKSEEVSVVTTDAPLRSALDLMCRQTGLDYGFFHNVVVIARPDRLWPGGKSAPVFGPPGAERQHRAPEEEKAYGKLRTMKVNLDLQNASVQDSTGYMQAFSGMGFEIESGGDKRMPVFRLKDMSLFDSICLLTQCCDLDFLFKDPNVVIGTRDAIAKKVAGKK